MVGLPCGSLNGTLTCRCFVGLVLLASPAFANTNSWTKPTSGYWEEQGYWSLGILPDSSQSVLFNNPGWKALAIGTNATRNFPGSLQIQELRIASPVDSYNVLFMNFAGLDRPLQATRVLIASNSAVVMQGSALEVVSTSTDGTTGNLVVGGLFQQGDYSQVKVGGRLDIGRATRGAYFLTNGTLSAEAEWVGFFADSAIFVQYGGVHTVGALSVNTDGEFHMYDGELRATNGISVGSGDYANRSSFSQYGGNVKADMAVNGRYELYGGTITGKMAIVMPTYQRVDGSFVQAGGTNAAVSLDIGAPNRFGGRGFYTLSNGVLSVDSSLTFRGGQFEQYGGLNSIRSNLVMVGTDVGLGIAYAQYYLHGGTLLAAGLTQQAAYFQQDGGTNDLSGDLVILGAPPPYYAAPQLTTYTLAGGLLSATNVIVNAAFNGGFRQTGGTCRIAEKLTMQGVLPGAYYYTLEGGTLAVNDIEVAAGAFFQHTNGTIVHSGVLTLNQGAWFAPTGDCLLGPLQLEGQDTNSSIVFPGGPSILRLSNSSAQAWSSTATLIITNWHGSVSGGGDTRLFFGSDETGLTPQQLAQIKFSMVNGLYAARLLLTGEVVPQIQSPPLTVSRAGNTLTLAWVAGLTLEYSTNVGGPYQPLQGATSPYPLLMDKAAQFFRVSQ